MAMDKKIRHAMKAGRQQADGVLKFRDKELLRRVKAVKRQPVAVRAARGPAPIAPKLVRAAGGPGSSGVLVAEGDSWFDYPLNDILRLLEDHHGYDVESVAHKGDRVEDMAYGPGQFEEFARRLEKLLRQNVIPKAILLSGGGNDIAGQEFGMLINHALSPVAGLNGPVLAGVIDERIKFAYVTLLSAVTRICEQRLGGPVTILVHGYDYPVPDGRGFLGGWWILPGPWLPAEGLRRPRGASRPRQAPDRPLQRDAQGRRGASRVRPCSPCRSPEHPLRREQLQKGLGQRTAPHVHRVPAGDRPHRGGDLASTEGRESDPSALRGPAGNALRRAPRGMDRANEAGRALRGRGR